MKFLPKLFTIAILILIVVFAWQNSQVVGMDFIVWHWETSLALLIFISFGLGLLIGIVGVRIR